MAKQSGPEVSVHCTDKEIIIRGTVVIKCHADSVFYFFSSMKNDPVWRSEITRCEATGLGQISQYSFLSRKLPEYRQDYQITESDAGNRIFFARSMPENRFSQSSRRMVEQAGSENSKAIYEISFERAIIKEALGLKIPDFLLKFQMKRVTGKYLNKLKKHLESIQKP